MGYTVGHCTGLLRVRCTLHLCKPFTIISLICWIVCYQIYALLIIVAWKHQTQYGMCSCIHVDKIVVMVIHFLLQILLGNIVKSVLLKTQLGLWQRWPSLVLPSSSGEVAYFHISCRCCCIQEFERVDDLPLCICHLMLQISTIVGLLKMSYPIMWYLNCNLTIVFLLFVDLYQYGGVIIRELK